MADYVFLEITKDALELPVAVADTAAELARISGLASNTVRNLINDARYRSGKSRFIKVDVSEVNDERSSKGHGDAR